MDFIYKAISHSIKIAVDCFYFAVFIMDPPSFDGVAVALGVDGGERHASRNDRHGCILLVLALPAVMDRFLREGSRLLTYKELLFERFFDRLDLMTSANLAEFAVVAGT